MQSSVDASSFLQRKHSTAHYFRNGSVYVLGGIDNNHTNSSSIITLRLDKRDFSLHSSADSPKINYPTVMGHTSHVHYPSNTIISVLGLSLLQQHQPGKTTPSPPPLITTIFLNSTTIDQPSTYYSNITNLPNTRHLHTSVLINDTLHVIGGKDVITHKPVNDVMWTYSLSTQLWTQQKSIMPSMWGHITIVYDQWLISCFGQSGANNSLTSKCTWLDTTNSNVTRVEAASSSNIEEWPTARKYASMISLSNNNNNKFILFGGQNKSAILNDIWYLEINPTALIMNWTKINTLTSYKRTAHVGALIDTDVILYYGGQEGPSSLATDPIYFNITNKEWIHANKNQKSNYYYSNLGVDLDSKSANSSESNKISGGAVGGIIAAIACLLGLSIAYFVWKRRRYRRNQHLNSSRAARFSQSPSPSQQLQQEQLHQNSSILYPEKPVNRSSIIHYPEQGAALKEGAANSISLPELALYNKSRISTISLGTEFHFSAEEYHRQSHHSAASLSAFGSSQPTIPKIELNNKSATATTSNNNSATSDSNKYEIQQYPVESLAEGKSVSYKRRGSTGFNRLTLNLFSNGNNNTDSQQQETKKSRSSGLFQLRSSRLLQPSTTTTPNMSENRYPHIQSRVSLGAKSVSSVQWVGFNDNMDGWRDSTGSSLHLAVTNAQRSSLYYSDSSAQSTPRSPMFPQYLKDSAIQHQMFGQDNNTKSSPEEARKSAASFSKSNNNSNHSN